MTELEILRRRRELVILSAELQRATFVRRLDRVTGHPAQVVLGLASSVASLPLAYKLGSMLWRVIRRNRNAVVRKERSLLQKLSSLVKYAAVLKSFHVPKFFHR